MQVLVFSVVFLFLFFPIFGLVGHFFTHQAFGRDPAASCLPAMESTFSTLTFGKHVTNGGTSGLKRG